MPTDFWIKLVELYYTASYKYYVLDEPTGISDKYFDDICLRLLNDFEEIPEDIKSFLDADELKAGSGYTITEKKYNEYLSFIKSENS
jgi:NAD-dependent DNA ligase